MRTKALILAAAVTAGGMCFTSAVSAQSAVDTAAQKTENALERTGDAMRRAGDRLTGTTNPSNALAPDAEDIRETLKGSTQAALTKGGFDDLVERFVDADRNRLGKDGFTEKDHATLDGRIAQLQADWKAKYNQDFAMKDKEAVFTAAFATIIQSEVGGGARLASDRAIGSNATTPPAGGQPSIDPAQAQRDANKVAGGDTNLNPGRNIATIQVAASHGLPALSVPMIHEFPDVWKIDVPDNYSAEQMHDNLLKHLTMVGQMKDQWPADVNDAYRVVAHHVLMAVLNVKDAAPSMSPMPNNMNSGNTLPGSTGSGMNTTPVAPAR